MRSEKVLENSNGYEMTVVSEASVLIRQVAEPRPVGDSVKAAIGRAARRLGFEYSRSKDIWYANARRINADEIDALRRATTRKHQEEVARAEAIVAIDRLVALRSALAQADSDFHRETLASIDDLLRAMGRPVGTMAVREE